MKSPENPIDRNSSVDAEAVMVAMCPDEDARREILRCLLDSIAFAERIAPGAWAVTLFPNGFRLNVGPVEALTCVCESWPFPNSENGPPILKILTQGAIPESMVSASAREADELEIRPANYKSVALPQHAVAMTADDAVRLREWFDELRDAHHQYIKLALQTPSGRARTNTAFKRTHSPGLVEYARAVCEQPTEPSPPIEGADEPASDGEERPEYFEGRPISIQTTRYERRPAARRACLSHHGYLCAACGFSFGRTYGAVAEHYIQVHHLNPVASIGFDAAVNPVAEMRPLCANCHAVAHFRSPPYSIDEIKAFLNQEPNHE
ncbi:MAG: hypothetical protein JSS17_01750 [Proteobacteria bacterium]|nr:hypothetical protein [Pseudomonadota bacterium]